MVRTKHLLFPAVAALAVLLSSCVHTKAINAWRDPDYQGRPNKMLVHVIATSPTVKIVFENLMAERLKERGVDAVVSHGNLPDRMDLDKEAMKRFVQERGIDTVFVAHAISKRQAETLRPGQWLYGSAVYEDPEDEFFMAVTGPLFTQETYAVEEAVVEMIVYDVAAKKRIWMIQTETFIWHTKTEEIKPAVEQIMKYLVADKIVP